MSRKRIQLPFHDIHITIEAEPKINIHIAGLKTLHEKNWNYTQIAEYFSEKLGVSVSRHTVSRRLVELNAKSIKTKVFDDVVLTMDILVQELSRGNNE